MTVKGWLEDPRHPPGTPICQGAGVIKIKSTLEGFTFTTQVRFFPVRYWFIYRIGLAGICGRLTTLVEESNRVAQADRGSNMLLKSSFLPTTAS